MYKYRCKKRLSNGSQCDTRRSLKKKVEQYKRKPKCFNCGSTLKYIDKSSRGKFNHIICLCGDPHYPHREGATIWCKHHPIGPTEKDYEERYGK